MLKTMRVRVQRGLAFLLCIIMTFTSLPMTGLAAQSSLGGEASLEGNWEDGYYFIKAKRNVQLRDGEPELPIGDDSYLLTDENAVVKKYTENGNTRYHIWLSFDSYSAYDMLQIINPQYNEELAGENFHDSESGFPLGDFNVPDTWKSTGTDADGFEYCIITDSSVNQYYFSNEEFSVSLLDEELDRGLIEFDLESLEDYVIIRPASSYMPWTGPAIICFEEASMESINENFSLDAGEYTLGRSWGNYAYQQSFDLCGRGTSAEANALLKKVFKGEIAASVSGEGKISAELLYSDGIFSVEKGEDRIVSAEIAVSRDMSVEGNPDNFYFLQSEMVGTVFEPLDITGQGITLEFENLLDNKLIRFQTAASKEQGYYYWGKLYLTQEIVSDAEPVTVKSEETGAVLKTDTDSFQEGYNQFICTISNDHLFQSAAQIKSYSETDESLVVYKYYIADDKGNRVVPKSVVVIELPIPEEFNPDTTAFNCRNTFGLSSYTEVAVNEEGKKILRITPTDLNNYDGVFAIYDTGVAMTADELNALEPGYYKVRPTFRMIDAYDRPSMAAPAIINREGILHVSEDGEPELYLTFRGVNVAGAYGYIYKMYYKTLDGGKYPVDILAYMSTADLLEDEWESEQIAYPDRSLSAEELDIDSFSRDYKLHYIHMLKLPLGEMNRDNEWNVSFVVPFMNAFGGDIKTSEKTAGLRLIAGTCEPVSEEECPQYNLSVLLGTIEDAQWYLDELGETDEKTEEYSALSAAISAAKDEYQALKASFDTEKLLAAVEALNAAITAAGGNQTGNTLASGTYEIPFKLWNTYDKEHVAESMYKDNFSDAVIKVSQNTMTIDLSAVEANGTTIEGIKYYAGENEGTKEAEAIVDESGTVTGYRLVRPYDENEFRLELTVSGKNYTVSVSLELDFKNAVKITASEEEVAALEALLAEAKAILAAEESANLYTASSLSALKEAAANAETALSASDSLEYDTVATQTEKLTAAKVGLVQKADVKNMLEQKLNETILFMDNQSVYTEASFAVLSAAVSQANQVLAGYEMTDEKIAEAESAMEALDAAVAGLKYAALERLEGLISEAEELSEADYTSVSWSKLSDALAAAKEKAESPEASDSELSEAAEALTAAKDSLVLKAYEELGERIAELEAITSEGYTEESFKSFAAALAEAKSVYGASDSDKAAYEAAYEALGEAYSALTGEKPPAGDDGEDSEAKKALEAIYEAQLPTMDREDEYEETSFDAWKASMAETEELLSEDRGYEVTDAQLAAQKTALEAEYKALILVSSLYERDTAAQAALYSAKKAASYQAPKKTGVTGQVVASASNASVVTASSSNAAKASAPSISLFSFRMAESDIMTMSVDEELDLMALPDGVYRVDYCLWQFNKDDYSMGNDALLDAYPDVSGKQAQVEVEDGKVYLWLNFGKKTFSGLTGRLLYMDIIENIIMSGTTLKDYTKVAPVEITYTDETDEFLPEGEKYPETMKFDVTDYVTAYKTQIPVFVNVPVMGSSAEQPAYINLYYDTFTAVEDEIVVPGGDDESGGDDEDDENGTVTEREKADVTALRAAMAAAETVDSAKYTEASYLALDKSYDAADRMLAYVDGYLVLQSMVDSRTEALKATKAALIPKPAEDTPINPDEPSESTAVTQARNALISQIVSATLALSDYTEASQADIKAAIKAAQAVYDDASATERQLKNAKTALENALAAGELSSGSGDTDDTNDADEAAVAKAKLQEMIKYAGNLSQAQYTNESWTILSLSLINARAVYTTKTATASELDAARAELEAAVKGLVAASDDDGSTGDDDDDVDNDPGSSSTSSKNGYYKVSVRLWHASMNKASMGDDAIVRTAYVHIEDGEVTMRLVTKEMETSGITAHLHDFYIYRDGDYETTNLAAETGDYWIYEFELPNSSSQYYKCKVDPQVDVMGDEPVKARLKVNWSGKKAIDSDDWDSVIDDPDDIISTKSSSGSSSGSGIAGSAELMDNDTGARLVGNIGGPGAKLEIRKLDNGAQYEAAAVTLSDKDKFVLYDVKVKDGDSYLQPSEAVKLRLPIPIGYDSSRLTIYRISDDCTARSEMVGAVNGSYYEVAVDRFSYFALAENPAPAQTAALAAQALDAGAASAAAGAETAALPAASAGSSQTGSLGSSKSSGSRSLGSSGSSLSARSSQGSASQAVSGAAL